MDEIGKVYWCRINFKLKYSLNATKSFVDMKHEMHVIEVTNNRHSTKTMQREYDMLKVRNDTFSTKKIHQGAGSMYFYGAKRDGACLSLISKKSVCVCVCVFECDTPSGMFGPFRTANSLQEANQFAPINEQGVGASQHPAHCLMTNT